MGNRKLFTVVENNGKLLFYFVHVCVCELSLSKDISDNVLGHRIYCELSTESL